MAKKQRTLGTVWLLGVSSLVAAVAAVAWSQWNSPQQPDDVPPPQNDSAASEEGPTLLADKTADSGIAFSYRNGEEADNYAIIESLGGGVGVLDYDGDGLLDVVATGGGYFDGPQRKDIKGYSSKVFKNLGQWKFRDVTVEVGLDKPLFFTHGLAVADYDRDGWPDLLVSGWHKMALYHNESDGKGGRVFKEVAATAGLPEGLWSTSCAWGDLDKDGYPDLYVCQYVNWSFDNHPICPGYGYRGGVPRDTCPPGAFDGLTHRLFRNNGNGKFTDVSKAAGLLQETKNANKGLGVIMVDVDADSRPDIYVANDTTDNLLYMNRSSPGKLSFVERGVSSGVARDELGRPNGSMGIAAADFEGSGRPSLFVTNFEGELHALYRNGGNGRFTPWSLATGMAALGRQYVGWGTGFVDLDNDGWEDLIANHGHAVRYPAVAYSTTPRGGQLQQKTVLLLNNGTLFREITGRGGPYCQPIHRGRGLAVGDLDNDGRADFVLSNVNEPLAILRNEGDDGHGWLGVDVVTKDHADVVGGRVTLEVAGRTLTRFVKAGGSYASASDPRLLFGLAKAQEVGRLTVYWPAGEPRVQHWDKLPINRYHRLVQGTPAAQPPRGKSTES